MSAVAQAIDTGNAVELAERELRASLDGARTTLLAQTLQITDLKQRVVALSATLGHLCQLTLAGKSEEAAEELQLLSLRYQAMEAAIAARKVH